MLALLVLAGTINGERGNTHAHYQKIESSVGTTSELAKDATVAYTAKLEAARSVLREKFVLEVQMTMDDEIKNIPVTLLDNTTEMARHLCGNSVWQGASETSAGKSCVASVDSAFEARQIQLYYKLVEALHEHLRVSMGKPNIIKEIEGHTAYYIEKMKLLRKVAKGQWVPISQRTTQSRGSAMATTYVAPPTFESIQNICEIGFNAGHSALNWLSSHPTAHVTAFDLGQHQYSAHAVNFLSQYFPGE